MAAARFERFIESPTSASRWKNETAGRVPAEIESAGWRRRRRGGPALVAFFN
jgi:hypothetical protein